MIVGAVVTLSLNKGSSNSALTTNPGVKTPVVETPSLPAVKVYTLAEVATHKTASSCWTTINSKVYDLTSWISEHPGGSEAILEICGRDGSAAFNDQHGGDGKPTNILVKYQIAELAK